MAAAPLARLDVMNDRAVRIGWLFLTVGVAIGAIWAIRARPEFADPRVQAMTIVDPKILVALVCWAVCSFPARLARRFQLDGRRGTAIGRWVRYRIAELPRDGPLYARCCFLVALEWN